MSKKQKIVTFQRDDLRRLMPKLVKVVVRTTKIPILSRFKIDVSRSTISLTATDLDNEIVGTIPAEGKGEWSTTLPAGVMAQIISGLPNGCAVTLEMNDEGNSCTISAQGSTFSVHAIAPSEFPEFAVTEYSNAFDLPGAVVADVIGRVAFAMSLEETRYYLNGVLMHLHGSAEDACLRFVATDGHRLSLFDIPLPDGVFEKMPNVIIPRKTIAFLSVIAAKAETVRIEVGERGLRFTVDGIVLRSKVIDGTYPDYMRVIPKSDSVLRTVVFDSPAMLDALKRVAVFAKRGGRGTKFTFDGQGSLKLSSKDPDFGQADASCPLDSYVGDSLEIGFCTEYIGGVLRALRAPFVTAAIQDAGGPVMFSSVAAPGHLTILMPMRI